MKNLDILYAYQIANTIIGSIFFQDNVMSSNLINFNNFTNLSLSNANFKNNNASGKHIL